MRFCVNCGAEAVPGAKFCGECGAAMAAPDAPPGAPPAAAPPVEPVPAGPAPAAADAGTAAGSSSVRKPAADAGGPSSDRFPSWAIADWPLAVVTAVGLLFALVLVGAVWGLLMGVAANGLRASGFVGALAGIFLPFAGLGADTTVFAQAGGGGLVWGSRAPSPTVMVGVGLLAWLALRFALRHVSRGPRHEEAFVGKFVLVTTFLVAVVGGLLSVGDVGSGVSGDDFEIVSSVGSGEAAWWMLVVLLAVAAWALTRLGVLRRPAWLPSSRAGGALGEGARAAVLVVAALGFLACLAAIVVADDGPERTVAVLATPLLGANAGSATHAVAVGASDGIGGDLDGAVRNHVSLFNWGFPPVDDAGGAPIWLLPLLLVTPAVAGWATWRRLRRDARTGEDVQSLLAIPLLVVAGFALVSWLFALLAPLRAVGLASSDEGADGILRAGVAEPSVAATLGLSALWALVGAAVATALWASRDGNDLLRRRRPESAAAAPSDAAGEAPVVTPKGPPAPGPTDTAVLPPVDPTQTTPIPPIDTGETTQLPPVE